jgi:hypothetical protein
VKTHNEVYFEAQNITAIVDRVKNGDCFSLQDSNFFETLDMSESLRVSYISTLSVLIAFVVMVLAGGAFAFWFVRRRMTIKAKEELEMEAVKEGNNVAHLVDQYERMANVNASA